MKRYILLTLFIISSLSGVAQDNLYNPEEYLPWSSGLKLSWNLFEGNVSPDTFGDAGTAVKIQAKPFFYKGEIYYHVHALFNKKQSWYKETSDELLAHEQGHFDIAELTARQIRKKVNELKKAKVIDLEIYNKEIEKILIASNQLDEKYDKETLHGILKKEQKKWQDKIHKDLLVLKPYEMPDK